MDYYQTWVPNIVTISLIKLWLKLFDLADVTGVRDVQTDGQEQHNTLPGHCLFNDTIYIFNS